MQTQTQNLAGASYVLYGGSNGCVLQKMWKATYKREMGMLVSNKTLHVLLIVLIPMISFSQGKNNKKSPTKKDFIKEEMVLDIYTRDIIWHMNIDRNMVTNSENKDTLYFKNTDKMFSYVAKKTLETINFEKVKKVQDSILNRKKLKVKNE